MQVSFTAAEIAALTQPQSTFEGNYFQLDNAYCNPKPVQTPHLTDYKLHQVAVTDEAPKATLFTAINAQPCWALMPISYA